MFKFFKKHPALSGIIISLIGAVVGFFIKSPEMIGSLLTVAAVFLGVRQVVIPVTDATVKITEAATTAATKVVESLDKTVVGTVGTVTPVAESIINNTVDEVVGGIIGSDGLIRGLGKEIFNKNKGEK